MDECQYMNMEREYLPMFMMLNVSNWQMQDLQHNLGDQVQKWANSTKTNATDKYISKMLENGRHRGQGCRMPCDNSKMSLS
jgi:hypothetical protein